MIYTQSKIYSAQAAAKELEVSAMTILRRIKAGLIHAQNLGTEQRPLYAIHESELYFHRLYILGEVELCERIPGLNLKSTEYD